MTWKWIYRKHQKHTDYRLRPFSSYFVHFAWWFYLFTIFKSYKYKKSNGIIRFRSLNLPVKPRNCTFLRSKRKYLNILKQINSLILWQCFSSFNSLSISSVDRNFNDSWGVYISRLHLISASNFTELRILRNVWFSSIVWCHYIQGTM